jgi:beta-glucosidase-like glycosyl hydrolase
MTEDEKLWCLDGDAPFWAGLAYLAEAGYHKSPFRAGRIERLGLDGFAFSDGPRGVVVDHATCFPVTMARGATWDPGLEERVGEAIGRELRSVGADLYGGVCVNLLRHPAWGRAQETYGEDPFHVGEMGAALTRGVQRHAMACVKHFACNSMENARFVVDITVDEAALHDVYLPHFKRIVDEGVAAVMTAYNRVNGAWCGENEALVDGILRREWGFEGFVISDWILGIRDAAQSVRAGLDVEMPYRMIRAGGLRRALDDGSVSWGEVERAAERVIATRLRFDPVLRTPPPGRGVLANPGHRALAREVSARSVVLLRNEPVDGRPVLPLELPPEATLALFGRLATTINLGDGGSSDVWAPEVATVADGLRAALPDVRVIHAEETDPDGIASLAGAANAALVVVGYTRDDEGEFIGEFATAHLRHLFPGPDDLGVVEQFDASIADERSIEPPRYVTTREAGGFATGGDRKSLRLHEEDVALIRAVAGANPRTVVAIVAGSAVLVSEWDTTVPAVLQSWYAGMEGGHGLAAVLLGEVDASGRLPFSVPTEESHLPPFDAESESFAYDQWHGYWHLARAGTQPAYPFGFGLSYTTVAITGVAAEAVADGIQIRASLRNTGGRGGGEVVQVYVRRAGSRRPARLMAFKRIELAAGDDAAAELRVSRATLAERDTVSHSMVVRPGTYEVRVARHACDAGTSVAVAIS